MQQHHENCKSLTLVDNPMLNRTKYIMAHSEEISQGQLINKYQCSQQLQANYVTKK